MPGHHTARQKRMAHHIIASAKKRGYDEKRSKETGWATVNKYKKALGPRGGEGMSKATRSKILSQCFEKACKTCGSKRMKKDLPMMGPRPSNGPTTIAKDDGVDANGSVYAGMGKAKPDGGYVATPNPIKKPRHAPESPTAQARYSGKRGEAATARVDAKKSFKLVSIDEEYAALVAKADGSAPGGATPAPAVPAPQPKKFPRKMKPTVKMKPISDSEAMANLKAGKYHEKALRYHKNALKALATGYGNVSGGGALKAPNRGFPRASRSERDRPVDLMLAMDAQPAPAKAGPPKVYLPGVHNPKSPVRPAMGLKRPGKKSESEPEGEKKLKKTYPTINASMRPSVVSKKSPKPLDAGGATILSLSLSEPSTTKSSGVVNKSSGDAAMNKTNFNNLFKSELGTAADDVLCDCPHCEAPITKSDLTKAHEGKGKTTHLTGKKEGKSGAHVVDQNPTGGVMRGGEGHGVLTPSRGVPGAKKHDENHVQSTAKHNKKPIVKAETDSSDDSSDAGSSDAGSSDAGSSDESSVVPPKKMKKSISIRGTDYVQYVDDGSDAALAKSIAEGTLGGMGPANGQPTQPMDLNNDLTRLLY